MKYTIIFLMLLIQQGLFSQEVSSASIFQEGKQMKMNKEGVFDLNNQTFSFRYFDRGGQTEPKILFFADKAPFEQLGQDPEDEEHGFGIGTTRALGYEYKSYYVNTLEYDYKGNYMLSEYSKKIKSSKKGVEQYEFTIKQLEGVEMKDFFLDTLYVAIFFDNNLDHKIDEGELVKFTLHFLNSTSQDQVAEDIINLEQIDFKTFNADLFYPDAVKKLRIFKGLTTKDGYEHNEYSEDPAAFIQYNDGMYSSQMKSVSFRNIHFPIMQAMTTLDGRLMAVAAVSEYSSFAEIKKVNESLYRDFGNPVRKDIDGRTSVTWDMGDRVLQMSFEIYERYPEKVINRIFIANKKDVDKVQGRLGFGIWYRFD